MKKMLLFSMIYAFSIYPASSSTASSSKTVTEIHELIRAEATPKGLCSRLDYIFKNIGHAPEQEIKELKEELKDLSLPDDSTIDPLSYTQLQLSVLIARELIKKGVDLKKPYKDSRGVKKTALERIKTSKILRGIFGEDLREAIKSMENRE